VRLLRDPGDPGSLRSRDRESLLAEARLLVRRGARELNLIGQDITAYGLDAGEGWAPSLVRALCAVRGVRWVRLLYLYPSRVDDGIVDLLRSEEKVCRYLDIPVQHIDPGILRGWGGRTVPMRSAGCSTASGRDSRRLPADVPDRRFPRETRAAFDRLLRFVDEARWDYLGVFPYSRKRDPRLPVSVAGPGADEGGAGAPGADAQVDLLARTTRRGSGKRSKCSWKKPVPAERPRPHRARRRRSTAP